MSKGHIKSGDCINLTTLRDELDADATYALVKTDDMEVIRMALPHGKTVEQHIIDSEISVLCLKGDIFFNIDGKARELKENDWLYLKKNQPFSYSVKSDTILLVTYIFSKND